MSMPKRFLPLAVLSTIVFLAGCSHLPFIGKKFQHAPTLKHKENSHIATETEKEFRQRWETKRINDLVSQGLTAEAARAQAETEFAQKFSATHVAGH